MHLPPNRAFLVMFSDDEATSPDGLSGRIEHVRSGQRLRFRSREELHSFVLRIFGEEEGGETTITIPNQDEPSDRGPR